MCFAKVRRTKAHAAQEIPKNPCKPQGRIPTKNQKKGKKDFYEGLILDISGHGALLAVKEPLSLGSELFLLFKITLPETKLLLHGNGRKIVRSIFL